MNTSLLYVVGTLLIWVGWFGVFRAAYFGVQFLMGAPEGTRPPLLRGLLVSTAFGAVGLLVGGVLTRAPAQVPGEEFTAVLGLPLVWLVMPFAGWVGFAAIFFVGLRLVQGWLAIQKIDRVARWKAAGIWALVAALMGGLFSMDPNNRIDVLKGTMPVTLTTLVAIALLAVAGMVSMVLSAKAASTRGLTKRVVVHLALITGSIVFGIPFAWLVITSFKEDRDMASPAGLVWIPRVQQTVPYMDPRDPLFEGTFQGRQVQASLIETLPDGRLRLDIIRPAAMRGLTFEPLPSEVIEVPKQIPLVTGVKGGTDFKGKVIEEMPDGHRRVAFLEPSNLKGQEGVFQPAQVEPVREVGLRTQNYVDALEFLPPEANSGLVYLRNTLILVVLSVIGTILSSSIVAYAFSRLRFPAKEVLFTVLLSTMMLPAAVTLLPQFLIFRSLGWIDTLLPLWVPAFFASAFNVFLLRQFFMQLPMELEDASKVDGCSYFRTFWSVMLPQIKPALAVITIWTFMGAWNNFMGPLIYINSPENMPISYALQLFQSDRGGEPGLLMAFATMSMLPVLALFFFAQKYFIEGVTLSGFGGR